jgi:hypothetical protein
VARSAFLAAHFDDLQGLRWVPLWALFLLTPLLYTLRKGIGHSVLLWSLPAVIVAWWFWIRWHSRFSISRFGAVEAKSSRAFIAVFAIPAIYSIVCIGLFGPGWMHHNNSCLALFCVCWLAAPIVSPKNPVTRRVYYAAGLVVTIGLFVYALAGAASAWWPTSTALLGAVLLAVSLLDHWLLLRTFREIHGGV